MIKKVTGDILKAPCDILVNPVNCVGVMGAGLAKQVLVRFPAIWARYDEACASGELIPGKVLWQPVNHSQSPLWIVHFPTKRHWREMSRLLWIEQGLQDLVNTLPLYASTLKTLACPMLGCGLGGLSISAVEPLIEKYLGSLSLEVQLYSSY